MFVVYLLNCLMPLMSLTMAYWLLNWRDLTCLLQFYLGFSLSLLAWPSRLNMAAFCRHRNLLTDVLFKVLASAPHSILLWKMTWALYNTDLLFKYANDTNLLVAEISDVDINDQFNNVLKWAKDNRMIVHLRFLRNHLLLIGSKSDTIIIGIWDSSMSRSGAAADTSACRWELCCSQWQFEASCRDARSYHELQ